MSDEITVPIRPSAAAKMALDHLDERTVCGGRVTVVWTAGPQKGKPVTLYCAEPLCINTGACTGPRFVPHMQQYTTVNTDAPGWGPRKLKPREIIEAVKQATAEARKHGALGSFNFTDTQIARYVGRVWQRTLAAVRGDGTGTTWGH